MKRMAISAALLLTATVACGMTADELVQRTGVAGGLCAFPRATPEDETLALDLAQRPSFFVHLMARDAASAERVRAAADAAGVLGRSLYIEQGEAAPLPFADRLVDLLVVSDLRDADLKPEWKRDWLRVLAPIRGAALVRRAQAGLSKDALTAWTKDLALAKVTADPTGLWAVLRKELPAGSEAWTHRCHGPDNAQVSGDTTLKDPFLTQWWGLPRKEGFWGTTVVSAHGRVFTIRSSRNHNEQVFLTSRSLTSGVVLWQKVLRQATETEKVPHGGYIPGRSCAVVEGETLYLIDRDNVRRMDAETGADRDPILGPKPDGQIKWISLADGALATLAGEADRVHPKPGQVIAANPTGRELAVHDAQSRKELWHETSPGDIDERLIAAREGRLYSLAQGVGVVCHELRTGKKIWTNADAEVQADFGTPDLKVMEQFFGSQPALVVLDDVLLLRAKWAKNLTALSRTDGRLLWQKPLGGQASGSPRGMRGVTVDGLWLGSEGGPLDLKTGQQPVKGPRFIFSGCGQTTYMPAYLITPFGSVMETQSNRMIRADDLKSPCDVGSVVSEGILLTVPSECGCPFELKGYRTLVSAGPIQPHTAPDWRGRLTVLDPAEPAPLAMIAADWPTYRHDPRRSAASPATVGSAIKRLWLWRPRGDMPRRSPWQNSQLTPDYLATAPVAAAGRVWFASHDGTIRCLEAASGKELWRFPTGAMLFAPPTVWEGRVLAGGGDGRVYCLDATTGRCLWRFLAAPYDRRVFWFGRLINTWPVVPGVVVDRGVAYTVAGYQKGNGIHAYAFDPKSGRVIWENDNAGAGVSQKPESGLSSGGNMALADGKLWLASSPAGCFDLKTGEWSSLGPKPTPMSGGEFGWAIGALGPWVLQGGPRLSETGTDFWSGPLPGNLMASHVDRQMGCADLTTGGTCLPAWDADLVLMPPRYFDGGLNAVPPAKFLAWLADRPAAVAAARKMPKLAPKPTMVEWVDLKTWTTERGRPAAFALSADQAVVAGIGKSPTVSGYLRADGTKAWTAELPVQPAMDRLALDRDGRVLISLCDGSVVCFGR